MQVKSAIMCITMALAAVTVLNTSVVHGEEMTYYSKAASTDATPVVYSSSGKVISPARVKVMQNEQKILGHSPYAKAASVDLATIPATPVAAAPAAPVAPAPAPAAPVAPVVYSSSGKVISPARVKVMQNEQKILGHSPYAKAASVDLSQVGSSAVPVVTPAPVPAPVPTSAPTPIAADASLSPERIEIIQMELKELGFSPHAEATGVDLKKAGFVAPDRAASTANSDIVQTGASY